MAKAQLGNRMNKSISSPNFNTKNGFNFGRQRSVSITTTNNVVTTNKYHDLNGLISKRAISEPFNITKNDDNNKRLQLIRLSFNVENPLKKNDLMNKNKDSIINILLNLQNDLINCFEHVNQCEKYVKMQYNRCFMLQNVIETQYIKLNHFNLKSNLQSILDENNRLRRENENYKRQLNLYSKFKNDNLRYKNTIKNNEIKLNELKSINDDFHERLCESLQNETNLENKIKYLNETINEYKNKLSIYKNNSNSNNNKEYCNNILNNIITNAVNNSNDNKLTKYELKINEQNILINSLKNNIIKLENENKIGKKHRNQLRIYLNKYQNDGNKKLLIYHKKFLFAKNLLLNVYNSLKNEMSNNNNNNNNTNNNIILNKTLNILSKHCDTNNIPTKPILMENNLL